MMSYKKSLCPGLLTLWVATTGLCAMNEGNHPLCNEQNPIQLRLGESSIIENVGRVSLHQIAQGTNVQRAVNGVVNPNAPLGWTGSLTLKLSELHPTVHVNGGMIGGMMPMIPQVIQSIFTVDNLSMQGLVDRINNSVRFVNVVLVNEGNAYKISFTPSEQYKKFEIDATPIINGDPTLLPNPLQQPVQQLSYLLIEKTVNEWNIGGQRITLNLN